MLGKLNINDSITQEELDVLLTNIIDKPSSQNCEIHIPDNYAMKEILGKTIKGVIVKKNNGNGFPAMAVYLVFDDNTTYEIYSDHHISFAGGVNSWNTEKARKYGVPPMENVLDISVNEG